MAHTFAFKTKENMEQKAKDTMQAKRADRLLTALHNTNDCGHAIVFLLEKSGNQPEGNIQEQTLQLEANLKKWNAQLEQTIRTFTLQKHLIILYKSMCPFISSKALPNTFEMADTLRAIGYYVEVSGEKPLSLSHELLVADVKLLEGYIGQTMKALVNAEYKDEWKIWGRCFSDLYMSMPFAIDVAIRPL